MFNKILIANRGEIAARIIQTAKLMGIETVAIYSDKDEASPYVKMADEAYLVGGAKVNESYLNTDKIIEIAKQTNTEAIHPGYGFLSENAAFAEQCQSAGIVFIGPSPEVITKMGSKIESRKAMQQANLPIVPGINTPLKNEEEALNKANEVGYPVMLKASAGGGGIGMQIVYTDQELKKAFTGNKKRATDFFGDGTMYLEKYISHPRHVEIQILADRDGNTIYLGDRECSIQRRNQKVIEEAPSPFIDETTRGKMGEAAVDAAKSIGYENAGTFEFLVDEEKNFYFLEMNTRLQVEHPITEEITGIDLVAEQFKIAAGIPLSIQQSDIALTGHALEARIYAEDPNTFFPSPGKITTFDIPKAEDIRHELGVSEGLTVTPYYDPMIAKLVIHGQNRSAAIERMLEVLNDYKVEGIKTNIPMLIKVFGHKKFQCGETFTNFVEQNL